MTEEDLSKWQAVTFLGKNFNKKNCCPKKQQKGLFKMSMKSFAKEFKTCR